MANAREKKEGKADHALGRAQVARSTPDPLYPGWVTPGRGRS